MSLTGGERAGILGAILLSGALVAAVLLYSLPAGEAPPPAVPSDEPGEPAPGEPGEDPAGGPPDDPHPRPEDPPRERPDRPEPSPGAGPFVRERERLRFKILELEEEIARLRARLVEAGIPLEEPEVDPLITAGEAIGELRLCGSETDPWDIEKSLDRIVEAGAGTVPKVSEFLADGADVSYSDGWNFIGGHWVGYPSLRIALLDVLHRIGGVEGQSALLTVLGRTENPLEICLIASQMEDLMEVPVVVDALEKAARRYLDLSPPRRGESVLVRPVLEVLAHQEPASAAESLLRFVRSPDRGPEDVELALGMIGELPAEAALPALVSLAGDLTLPKKAVRAARLLAESGREGATEALAGLLSGDPLPLPVRREIYRSIDVPAARSIERLLGRGSRGGLEALSVLDRTLADIEARKSLLLPREEGEADDRARRILGAALQKLSDQAERGIALRNKILGE